MSAFRICTIAAVVAGVSATLVPTSHAPVQKQQVTPFGGGPAVTTAAAAYSGLLHRRADDTCGYIDGTEGACLLHSIGLLTARDKLTWLSGLVQKPL
ncbi:hypothetical protein E5D57_001390 [Metarhizium anisopliae]|nr:hypothetical protein E5D57_001390 [Metarhizium anisopliae]